MKKTLILTALLVLGFAGFSLWVSLQVEATSLDVVAEVEARPDVRVIESRFDRGWLQSTAETHFEFRGAVGAAFQVPLEWAGRQDVRKRVGFVVTQRIEHGPMALWAWLSEGAIGSPVLVISNGSVVMDQEAYSEVAAVFGKLPNATWHLRVRANRNMTASVSMSATPLEPRDVEAGSVPRWVGSFGGLQGNLSVLADKLELSLTSHGVDLAGSDFALDLDGWSGHWKGTLSQQGPIAGEHSLRALQVHFRVPGLPEAGRRVSLGAAEWSTESDDDQLLLKIRSEEAGIDGLALRGMRMVAMWPRDPQATPGGESMGSEQTGFLPELEIESLEGRLPEGPVLISGRLQMVPSVPPELTEALVSAPTEPSTSWVGDLDVRFPERWVGRLFGEDADRFSALLEEGQLAREGDRIRSRLMWNETGWLANGLPIETQGWLDAVFPPIPESPVVEVTPEPEAEQVAEETPEAPEASAPDVKAIVSEETPEASGSIVEMLEGAPTDAPPASPAP